MALSIQKVVVQDILISAEESAWGVMLFRGTDNLIYACGSEADVGDSLSYVNWETLNWDALSDDDFNVLDELDEVWKLPSAPNVVGGRYFEVESEITDPEGESGPWIGYAAYDAKSQRLVIEELAGWTKFSERDSYTGETYNYYEPKPKTSTYSYAQIFAIETKYEIDFNGDGITGDGIKATYGEGLFSTRSGSLYWSRSEQEVGSSATDDAKKLTSDSKVTAAFEAAYALMLEAGSSMASRSIALDKDNEPDDVQIALPIYKASKGNPPLFNSLDLYDINSGTGKFKKTSLSKLSDILKMEVNFDTDFNGDGGIGDVITTAYGAGLYATASRSLYWSPSEESHASRPGDDAKLLSADPKVLATLSSAYALLTQAEASLESRSIALDQDNELDDVQIALPIYKAVKGKDPVFSSLTLYDINGQTGKYKTTSVSKVIDILKFESLFDIDFNRDDVVGDGITISYGAGLYGTASGALYWSDTEESVGSAPTDQAKLLSRDPKVQAPIKSANTLLSEAGASLVSRSIALDKDQLENDVQIALPVYKANKGGTPSFSSLSLYDINGETGKFKTTAITKLSDIRRYEALFEEDFNRDDLIGDPITGDLGEGLYATKFGSIYWSPAQEMLDIAPSREALLLSADPKFVAATNAAYALLDQMGGSLASRMIALDKDKIDNDIQIAFPIYKAIKDSEPTFASLNLYSINSTTGKYTMSSLTKKEDIFHNEALFEADFNGDSSIGNPL